MDIRGIAERARKAALSWADRLRGGKRRGGEPAAGAGGEPEPFFADQAEAGGPGAGEFPGFAPLPSVGDRIRGYAASFADFLRRNPKILLASAAGALALSAILLAAAVALRPPKPVAPLRAADPEALEILRLIPVPLEDPLADESTLDRPRKDRYTEEDIDRMWADLRLLPTEELRARNLAELRSILSAVERP